MSGENKHPIPALLLHPQHPCSKLLRLRRHLFRPEVMNGRPSLANMCVYVPLNHRPLIKSVYMMWRCAPWPVAGPRVIAACRAASAAHGRHLESQTRPKAVWPAIYRRQHNPRSPLCLMKPLINKVFLSTYLCPEDIRGAFFRSGSKTGTSRSPPHGPRAT